MEARLHALQSSASYRCHAFRRARWLEEGERPSRYFFRLSKASATFTQMGSVRRPDDSMASDIKDMVAVTRGFYKSLYARGQTSLEAQSTLLSQNLTSLLSFDTHRLDAEIGEEEVIDTIKQLARWKSPGPDGIPAEFYKSFSSNITPFLTRLFAECIEDQTLPRSFSVSRTILLFKQGDR